MRPLVAYCNYFKIISTVTFLDLQTGLIWGTVYSSIITSFFHTWPHVVTRKYSRVKFENSHGNLDIQEALRTTRHGMPQDVECHKTSDVESATRCGIPWDVICHETCYVHGKSHGHRYSMSWACWLSTKKPMSTHTSHFLLRSWQHVSIANTEL